MTFRRRRRHDITAQNMTSNDLWKNHADILYTLHIDPLTRFLEMKRKKNVIIFDENPLAGSEPLVFSFSLSV